LTQTDELTSNYRNSKLPKLYYQYLDLQQCIPKVDKVWESQDTLLFVAGNIIRNIAIGETSVSYINPVDAVYCHTRALSKFEGEFIRYKAKNILTTWAVFAFGANIFNAAAKATMDAKELTLTD